MVDDAKKAIGSGVVAIASASPDGKAGIVVGVTDDLDGELQRRRFRARVASVMLGGKGGGGRPDLAQAGGPNAAAIDQALASIEDALRRKGSRAMSDADRRRGLALLRRRVHVVLDGGSRDRFGARRPSRADRARPAVGRFGRSSNRCRNIATVMRTSSTSLNMSPSPPSRSNMLLRVWCAPEHTLYARRSPMARGSPSSHQAGR